MKMNKYFIDINNLSLSFGKKTNELQVLNNINLNVSKSETIVIIGPSGCGKSTLLKLIGGLNLNANISGTITINDKLPFDFKQKGRVGFAFQNPVLLRWRNVFENVLLPLELRETITYIEKELVINALTLTGIEDFRNAFPNELSGGMKQRVNLARTIVHNPELLLLDEPFGSLDELSRLKLNFELKEIIRSHSYTTILITHSLREALLLGDRILLLTHRPARLYNTFIPKLEGEVKAGIETSTSFNKELKHLTDIFSELEYDKK